MNKFRLSVALIAFVFSSLSWAQSEDDQYQEPTTLEDSAPAPAIDSAPAKSGAKSSGKATAATGAVTLEDSFKPGWNSNKLDQGVGISNSFLNGGYTFIYDTGLTKKNSWTYYFGYNKTADTFSENTTNGASGVGTITTTSSTTNSGLKSPKTFSLGASWNRRLFKNNFMQARWGIFGGLDYYTDVDYPKGSKSTSTSSATPTTTAYSESAYGTTEVSKSPSLKLGPMFDSYLFLRWFPNIAIGFQGGIFYTTNVKTTTKTKTTTQSYNIVSGVPQTPSSYSTSESTDTGSTGGAGSTFASNGAVFSFTGNFVLRYVW